MCRLHHLGLVYIIHGMRCGQSTKKEKRTASRQKRGIIYSGADVFLLGSLTLKPYRRALVGKLKTGPLRCAALIHGQVNPEDMGVLTVRGSSLPPSPLTPEVQKTVGWFTVTARGVEPAGFLSDVNTDQTGQEQEPLPIQGSDVYLPAVKAPLGSVGLDRL